MFRPITLDPASAVPLYRQLYDALREAILGGRLQPGSRLPSTRAFATDLGISRQTVLGAFDQLMAEGYLEGRVGAGTYVTSSLPDELLAVRETAGTPRATGTTRRPLSQRGESLAKVHLPPTDSALTRPFRTGIPAFDAFPFETWSRLAGRRWRNPPHDLLAYGNPCGYLPLRQVIAAYLTTTRGVRCDADQIIIVAGAQQALDLSARLLLDPGNVAWIENPVYLGARSALLGAGVKLSPVGVDEEGFDIEGAKRSGEQARLIYVTPSHQYPLGVTMSLSRRLELLQWAERANAWIIEDDYDSEYRYGSRPVASLQGLDSKGCVIYIGTFSKVLFPSLRLGYLVAPPDLVDGFTAAHSLATRHAPTLDQAILADFIMEGHFARHIRRTRSLYAERQAVLVESAREHLAGLLDVPSALTGMHLVGWLPAGMDDRCVSQAANRHGVTARALSVHYMGPPGRGGLVLGYAAFETEAIRAATVHLARVLETLGISTAERHPRCTSHSLPMRSAPGRSAPR